MKKILLTAALTGLPLFATAGGFAGLDLVSSKVSPDDTRGSADPMALQFKFGSWINRTETMGGELRLGLGIDDDSLNSAVDVEIDRYVGAYFRGQFPNKLPVRPYGLIGLSYIETTQTFTNGSTDGENYSDISLGLGTDITLSKSMFVSVEYLRAIDRSGDDVSNIAVGLNGRF